MVTVDSRQLRQSLAVTRQSRELIRGAMCRLLNQFNEIGPSWRDRQYQELQEIVNRSVLELNRVYKDLEQCEIWLGKLLALVEQYEQNGQKGAAARAAAAGAAGTVLAAAEAGQGKSQGCPKVSVDTPFPAAYQAVLDQRFQKGDSRAQKVFQLFAGKLKILQSDYTGTAHYSLTDKGVRYNAQADCQNSQGAGCTFFHELGHMIDHLSGSGGNPTSRSREFHDALVADGARMEQIIASYTPEQRAAFQRTMNSDLASSCSDLANFVTQGRVSGRWGHTRDYCRQPYRMEAEAFAHFFEAFMGGGRRLNYLRSLFPKGTAAFEKMLTSILANADPGRGERERTREEEHTTTSTSRRERDEER